MNFSTYGKAYSKKGTYLDINTHKQKHCIELTLLIDGSDGTNSVVAESGEDFNECFLLGTNPTDRIMQLLRVQVREGRHQSYHCRLEVPAQFSFKFVNQFLWRK